MAWSDKRTGRFIFGIEPQHQSSLLPEEVDRWPLPTNLALLQGAVGLRSHRLQELLCDPPLPQVLSDSIP